MNFLDESIACKVDTELFKQYQDNPGFNRWLADTVFNATYNPPGP